MSLRKILQNLYFLCEGKGDGGVVSVTSSAGPFLLLDGEVSWNLLKMYNPSYTYKTQLSGKI